MEVIKTSRILMAGLWLVIGACAKTAPPKEILCTGEGRDGEVELQYSIAEGRTWADSDPLFGAWMSCTTRISDCECDWKPNYERLGARYPPPHHRPIEAETEQGSMLDGLEELELPPRGGAAPPLDSSEPKVPEAPYYLRSPAEESSPEAH